MSTKSNQDTAAAASAATAVVIPDEAASMWRSLDPSVRAALIASDDTSINNIIISPVGIEEADIKKVSARNSEEANTNHVSAASSVANEKDGVNNKSSVSGVGEEDSSSNNSDDNCESPTERRRRYLTEAERIISFTDAVVAIAMTLLILPLMDASAEFIHIGTMKGFWSEYWVLFLALWVSFFIIWKHWLVHEYM